MNKMSMFGEDRVVAMSARLCDSIDAIAMIIFVRIAQATDIFDIMLFT